MKVASQFSVFGSQEAEDWMVEQQFAAERAEEKRAAGCDGELFVANRQIVGAEAEAAEVDHAKPAGDGKKTKLVVRVKQEYIDWLLANPHTHVPYKCPMTEQHINGVPPERREAVRALMARATATQNKIRSKHANFLEQYHLKGYAEEEIEVGDNEGVGN